MIHAEVAQLVEQRIRNARVGGSSPFFSTIHESSGADSGFPESRRFFSAADQSGPLVQPYGLHIRFRAPATRQPRGSNIRHRPAPHDTAARCPRYGTHQDINARIAQAIGRRDPDYLVTADNVRRFAEELRRQTDEAALSDDGRLFRVRVYRDDGGAPERLTWGLMTIGENGSLRVPVKELAELLGARLEWNREARRLRLTGGGRSFELTVGGKTAAADGEPVALADPATIEAGRTLVPLAETAAAFGWEVSRPDIVEREFEVVLKAPRSR